MVEWNAKNIRFGGHFTISGMMNILTFSIFQYLLHVFVYLCVYIYKC